MKRIHTALLLACASLATAPLAAQSPLRAGQTVTGTLEEGDRQMDDGSLYDAYVLQGRPGQTLVVRMSSDDFDTYLHWGVRDGGDWEEVDGNDDWGDGTDSPIVVRLGDEGTYELRAAGFDEDETGDYALSVAEMGEPPVAGRIRVGQTVEGELDESDFEGAYGVEDHYVIAGAAGETVTLLAESDDFDTYLTFGAWGDGEIADPQEDDDGGQGTNSQLVVVLDRASSRVIVRAFSGEELGAYTLRVLPGDQSQDWDDEEDEDWVEEDTIVTETAPVVATSQAESWARTGEPVEGWLGDGVPRDEDGHYYQEYLFRVRAGERVQVSVSSDEFDPFVQVGREMGDEFEPFAEDDDGGPDLDAELTWSPETPGVYTVRVTSALEDATGAYVMRVRVTR